MSDSSFDRALRGAARRGRQAGPCPDAEQLAAFVDGSLDAAERRAIEAHAADCLACTEHLALLASVAAANPSAGPARPWMSNWRWLVPLATAVLVVSIWARMPDDRAAYAPADEFASRATQEAEHAAPPRPEPENRLAEGDAGTPREPAAAPHTPAPQPLAAPNAKRQDEDDRAAALSDAARSRERAEGQAGAGRADGSTSAAPAREPSPTADRDAAGPAAPPARRSGDVARFEAAAPPEPRAAVPAPAPKQRAAEEKTDTPAAVKPAPAAAPTALSESVTVQRESVQIAPPPQSLIVPAGERRRYRAAGATLEQSDDSGTTWRVVFTLADAGTRITAGACASADACWFGATEGIVVVRSATDTRQVVLPVHADVTQIAATSASAAEVMLATGERFRTVDGGREWTRVP